MSINPSILPVSYSVGGDSFHPSTRFTAAKYSVSVSCGRTPYVVNSVPSVREGMYDDVVTYKCRAGCTQDSNYTGRRICDINGEWVREGWHDPGCHLVPDPLFAYDYVGACASCRCLRQWNANLWGFYGVSMMRNHRLLLSSRRRKREWTACSDQTACILQEMLV